MMMSSSSSSSSSRKGYKVLCVSCLHPKASDDVVRETLYREYNKKYGDISVRVMHEPDERVAYVYFRNFDDARDAKHSKSRIILFDKPALVEPVYENRRRSPSPHNSSLCLPSPHPTIPPTGSLHHHHPYSSYRYRSRSPLMDHHHPPPPNRRDFRDDYHHHHHDRHPLPPRHHGHHHHPPPPPHRYPYSEAHHRRYTKDNRPNNNEPPPPIPVPNKKDKFPNYLNHIPPEDDHLATRTLFTGNLELNITEEEMRRIFGRYGKLVDIDIKRPPPGTGNAYAFIRYENLDQAHRAKLELSGQYIGKFQCKIGYGKVNPTPKVWVGGCGSWTTVPMLEREFDRFGVIQKIEYRKGDPYAYIFYESIEAAQAAVQEMRGFPLGGQDKRLRMDFADIDDPPGVSSVSGAHDRYRDYNVYTRGGERGNYQRQQRPPSYQAADWQTGTKRPLDDRESDHRPSRIRRVAVSSPEPGEDRRLSGDEDENESRSPVGVDSEEGEGIDSLTEITKKTPNVWDGGLILKNSLFPTKFYLVEGNEDVVDFLKDESDKPHLKITQRLRLDQGKLDDVTKRMKSSNSHAIFLGVSDPSEITHENPEIQSRPLRNLVSYLKQKEAAGVISLNNKEGGNSGVLYCFPPCPFSLDLLRGEFSNIDDGGIKEDHLVVVVVCGNN